MSAFRRAFLATVLLLMVLWAISAGTVLAWGKRDAARQADAIVVLGAAQYAGHPSPVLRARLDHALSLWKRGFAPRLILTGGVGKGDVTSEAAVGRRYVLKRGVPDSAILLEHVGRTTRESMVAVSTLMHERGMSRAIFVSDPYHMLRLDILARAYGVVPFPSATPTSPIWASRRASIGYVVGESLKVPFTLLSDFIAR